MTTHVLARSLSRQALVNQFAVIPMDGEVKALAGVGCLETRYGDGWQGAGKGSNNIAAEQCGPRWSGDRFTYTDTHPNADGTSTPYRVDFRKFKTPIDGWRDAAAAVFVWQGRAIVRAAAAAGDFEGVSKCLYSTHYFEGFGKTPEARIAFHYRALSKCIAAADNAVAPVVRIHEIPPTLRIGARDVVRHGPVWLLQTELQIAADGAFGPVTRDTLNVYKDAAGLPEDGVCDAATWEALFADEYTPAAAA